MTVTVAVAVALTLALSACSGASNEHGAESDAGAPVVVVSVEEALATYRDWQQRTAEPVPISARIFALCRLPTLPEQQFNVSEHGGSRALLDWLNSGAVAGFAASGATPFPVGAAIVKEKLINSATGLTLVALGVMIKHPAGFDPPRADWEFAYSEPPDGILQGPTEAEYCGGCHVQTRATDFVYLDEFWRIR